MPRPFEVRPALPGPARRKVAHVENCNQYHFHLTFYGSNRNDLEMCVLCHNTANTDAAQRPASTDPEERTKPPQGINFNLLIHRIHTGENLKEAGKNYTVVGRNGSIHDFTHVRSPLMTPQGGPGDTRNCLKCHIECTGCHVTSSASSHALANTTSIGESCAVCHSSGSAFEVDKSHAQYQRKLRAQKRERIGPKFASVPS